MSPRLMKLAVPDLALSGAALTLFWALLLYDGSQRLFRDSDTGWHIRTGEAILATAQLPRVDSYSWSKPGETWFAWEWGADVLMGWMHQAGGLAGVVWLYLILIAACTWLWFRLHWVAGGDFLLACFMASPMLSTVNLHWLARPHVFGWVMLLVSLLWLDRLPCEAGWRGGLRGWLLGALWANLHASFFLLPLMAAAYAASHVLRPLVWPVEAPPEHARAMVYLAAAGGAAAGTFLNPYGWNLHFHVAQYLWNTELLKRIGEFQTFNFHAEGALQILMTVALAGAGAVLALGQRNLAHFFLLAGATAMALRSARALPLLALLLPLAGGAMARALREGSVTLQPALGGWVRGALHYSGNLRRLDAGFSGVVWAPVVALCAWALLHTLALAARTGFPPADFPVAAARVVAALPADARILAPDKFGGYLIYRFAGQRRVFFDGRSDYYGLAFMRHYIDLVQARPGAERELERYGFTHALLPPDYSLLGLLPRLGWRELYRDGTAVLLAAPERN
ncbi:MAG: hypothetical protein IT162_13075 [Bryobacterales bacterium]|nr:hypothetical protein [Bryobacterales bacterium]